MKLVSLGVSVAALSAAASASMAATNTTPTPAPILIASSPTATPAPILIASSSTDGSSDDGDVGAGTVRPADTSSSATDDGNSGDAGSSPTSPLESLKQKTYENEWHMKPVRVIHARVQSDDPALVEGRFVSSFGNGDLAKGYLSAMDSVNTASVEGALMYVQAEGINVNSRPEADRCTRKNNMRNIVFYDIAIVQTNETIAEYASTWKQERDTFEYGPMVPMDGGRCTAESTSGSKETLPKACLQYNGDGGQPQLGPMIGGYIKDDDVRAPYPSTHWFSFPHTCPAKAWAKKTDACRASTRKGLCDIGVAPDGVQCTFAYDILGWIPIDDVVGITSMKNKATGKMFSNFTEWCNASTKNNEFVGDTKTGEMKSGLKFWNEPLDSGENSLRAQTVVDLYNQLVSGTFKSGQISSTLLKSFKPLPEIDALRTENPSCYESVPICNSGNGCRREGYSQLCQPCSKKAAGCSTNGEFTFPTLVKAKGSDDLAGSESGSASSSEEGNTESSASGGTSIESPDAPPEATTAAKKTKAPTTQQSTSAHVGFSLASSVYAAVIAALIL